MCVCVCVCACMCIYIYIYVYMYIYICLGGLSVHETNGADKIRGKLTSDVKVF